MAAPLRYGLAAAAIAVFLAGGAATRTAHAPIAAPTARYAPAGAPIPFELFRGQRIIFEGRVNGRATSMMLDSGAGMTVVDRAYADSIGLKGSRSIPVQGAGGSVPGEIAAGVTLEAGGLRLSGVDVLILDLSPIERAVGRRIPVVLGREAFRAGIVSLDFPQRRIAFADRAGFRPPAGATRLEMRERDRLPSVKVGLAGLAPVEADLDLGNGGTLVVAQAYWSGQPGLASLRHAESQSGGVGGLTRARRVTLPEVALGEIRFHDVPATFNEDPRALPTAGANVGIELLKTFVVTLDTAGGALYLQATEQRPSFARERVGARFELAGDRLRTAYVSPDGPAAAAGIKAGDEIVAIDGRRVDPGYYGRPEWTRGPAGTIVQLERADGTRIAVTLADYY